MRLVVEVPGVLRDDTMPGFLPITEGVEFVQSFVGRHFLTFLDYGMPNEQSAKDWLRREQLWGDSTNLSVLTEEPYDLAVVRTVAHMRRTGGPPNLVVTASAALAKTLLLLGYAVVVFVQPAYARPESSPERKVWDEVVEQIEAKRLRSMTP